MANHHAYAPAVDWAAAQVAFAPVIELRDQQLHCGSCGLREMCMPTGLGPDAMRRLDQIISHRKRVRKRSALYRPGEAFTSVYAIRSGALKTMLLAEDGREQITGYHLPGDMLGLDGLGNDGYALQAIALEDSEVCVLPFDRLDELAHEMPLLQRNIYRVISKDIGHDQDMMLLLGSRTAEERLALFLLNLSERYHALGYSASEFILRMTREEIASYLGLKLETVSRLFSRLHEEGLIQVQGRAVKLLDAAALKHRARSGDS